MAFALPSVCDAYLSLSSECVCVLVAHLLSTICPNRNEADVKFETLLKTLPSNIICSIKLASVQYTCAVRFFFFRNFSSPVSIRFSSFVLIPYKYLELTENTAQELQHVKLSASVQKDCNCDFVASVCIFLFYLCVSVRNEQKIWLFAVERRNHANDCLLPFIRAACRHMIFISSENFERIVKEKAGTVDKMGLDSIFFFALVSRECSHILYGQWANSCGFRLD